MEKAAQVIITPHQQFEGISSHPERRGSVLIFRLWQSSYYPAGLEKWNRHTAEGERWEKLVKTHHLDDGVHALSGADFEGSLFVYEFETPDGPIHLAQMDLRRLFTKPSYFTRFRELGGEEPPRIDLSLVSRRALMPNFQQVIGMGGQIGEGSHAHIYTVDEEGSHWSHHVHQDWGTTQSTEE